MKNSPRKKRKLSSKNKVNKKHRYIINTENLVTEEDSLVIGSFPFISNKLASSLKFSTSFDDERKESMLDANIKLDNDVDLNLSGFLNKSSPSKFLIFRLNEEIKEATLLNTEKHSIPYNFKQNVNINQEKNKKDIKADYLVRRNALIDAFGSKVSKRIQKSREKGEIKAENLHNREAIESKILEKSKEDYEDSLIQSKRRILPFFNDKTEKKKKIFPMGKLFPQEAREAYRFELGVLIKLVSEQQEEELANVTQHYGSFVRSRLAVVNLDKVSAREERVKKFCLRILFIGVVHKIIGIMRKRISYEEFTKRTVLSKSTSDYLLSTYYTPSALNRYTLDQGQRHRIVFICLICCLYESDFSLSSGLIEMIANDLKLDSRTIERYLWELGCKRKNGSLQLVAPLVFNTKRR